MAHRLELHPEATSDGRAAYQWYKERSPKAAEAFLAELDQAIERVVASPNLWPTYLHGTKRYLMRRFPYGVVYRIVDDLVSVIAVAHTRRRPGYWRSRS
jgi:plasmid stabilization system protein ParE